MDTPVSSTPKLWLQDSFSLLVAPRRGPFSQRTVLLGHIFPVPGVCSTSVVKSWFATCLNTQDECSVPFLSQVVLSIRFVPTFQCALSHAQANYSPPGHVMTTLGIPRGKSSKFVRPVLSDSTSETQRTIAPIPQQLLCDLLHNVKLSLTGREDKHRTTHQACLS